MSNRLQLFYFSTPDEYLGTSSRFSTFIRAVAPLADITLINDTRAIRRDLVNQFQLNEMTFQELIDSNKTGIAIGVCKESFFSYLPDLKNKGFKTVFDGQMFFYFNGEIDAIYSKMLDAEVYCSLAHLNGHDAIKHPCKTVVIEPRIDPNDFKPVFRNKIVKTIGKLNRPDFEKYPDNFGKHWQSCFDGCQFMVQAWNHSIARRFWDIHYDPKYWSLLETNTFQPVDFWNQCDFHYYTTHPVMRETYGLVIAESLMAGCITIIQEGHDLEHWNNFRGVYPVKNDLEAAKIVEKFSYLGTRQLESAKIACDIRATWPTIEQHGQKWLELFKSL
jgi:hypothetical protein